jgi:choline dehydrogenase-like flavoprotein
LGEHLAAVRHQMLAVEDGALQPGLIEQHLENALALNLLGFPQVEAFQEEEIKRVEEQTVLVALCEFSLQLGEVGAAVFTCRMGKDPKDSVVDSSQRSHDHDNLYLVGSSTFPTGATANPTLTISALGLGPRLRARTDEVIE